MCMCLAWVERGGGGGGRREEGGGRRGGGAHPSIYFMLFLFGMKAFLAFVAVFL